MLRTATASRGSAKRVHGLRRAQTEGVHDPKGVHDPPLVVEECLFKGKDC